MVEIFLQILANNILPLFLVTGAGWLLAHFLKTDLKPVSQVALNVMFPCLIFNTLVNAEINLGQSGQMILFTIISILLGGLIGYLASRLLKLTRQKTIALMLAVMFNNSGNLGIPAVLYAFGQEAVPHAIVYMIVMLILVYTIGVALANNNTMHWGQVLLNVLRTPIVISVLIAVIFMIFRFPIPEPVNIAVSMLSDGAIPAMLVVLGIQLYNAKLHLNRLVWLAAFLKLILIPAAMLPISKLFTFTQPAFQAAMLETATPTSVSITLLAVEYNTDPEFISSVILITTLLSAITVTAIVFLLR